MKLTDATKARDMFVPKVTDRSQRTSLCSRVHDVLAGQLGMSCISRGETFYSLIAIKCSSSLTRGRLGSRWRDKHGWKMCEFCGSDGDHIDDPISIGRSPMQVDQMSITPAA